VDIWVGTVHGRLVWGSGQQSDWSVETGSKSRRFLAGGAATFSPRGMRGLELGFSRLFHAEWDGLGPGELFLPLQGLFKAGLSDSERDPENTGANQLASVFVRWVHPGAGLELWGEFARDDHNYDLRDFILEPDHDSGYVLGGRKVWRAGNRLTALRAELLNARTTHLQEVRGQSPLYLHTGLRQGHTQRGQVLGSPSGLAGLGSVVAVDRYEPRGRWSAAWTQTVRDFPLPERGSPGAAGGSEVTHALHVDRLFSRGPFEITAGGAAVYQLNRNFGDDAFNLSLVLKVSRGF
jgi:hypothetical protein